MRISLLTAIKIEFLGEPLCAFHALLWYRIGPQGRVEFELSDLDKIREGFLPETISDEEILAKISIEEYDGNQFWGWLMKRIIFLFCL